MKITSAMLEYISERRKGIDRHEREQYRLQRQKEVEERDNNSISYVEYLEQEKKLVESGDKDAIERASIRVGIPYIAKM